MFAPSIAPMLVSYASYGLLALFTALLGVWSVINWLEKKAEHKAKERKLRYVHTPIQMLSIIRRKRYELVEKRISEKYGSTYGCSHLGTFTIVTSDPELVQLVCTKEFTKFSNRRDFELGDPLFQAMVGASRDERWKRLRSIMTPTFSTGKLRKIKFCIDETAMTLLNNFEKALDQSEVVNMKQYVGAFTMDTIVQMAFGVQIDSLIDENNPLIMHAKRFFSTDQTIKDLVSFAIACTAPKLATKFGVRINGESMDFFERIAMNIIAKKREEIQSRGSIGKATNFIELLLEAEQEAQKNDSGDKKSQKYITNSEILAQCIFFFMAGYDTTANAISNTLYNLAKNSEKEAKLYCEVTNVLEQLAKETGKTDPFELITLDSLSRFEYLNACINETLRLYPPGTAVERSAAEDVHLELANGKFVDIKKGDVVRIPIYSLHHNPNNFSEPEEFKPERFLGEPSYNKHAYIPFGTGPRNCIARSLALLETRMAVLHLIRKYRFSTCKKTMASLDFYVTSDVMIAKDTFLKVERR